MKKQQKLSLKKMKVAKINYNLHRIKGGTGTITNPDTSVVGPCGTLADCNSLEVNCTTSTNDITTQRTRAQGGNSVITCGIDPNDDY